MSHVCTSTTSQAPSPCPCLSDTSRPTFPRDLRTSIHAETLLVHLVHLVRLLWSPCVSGGVSLDKASNHPGSPENPGEWLNTPRYNPVAEPKCTTAPRALGRVPPRLHIRRGLSTSPPDNQPHRLQDLGSEFWTTPPLKFIVKTAPELCGDRYQDFGFSHDPPPLCMREGGTKCCCCDQDLGVSQDSPQLGMSLREGGTKCRRQELC